MYKAVVFDLDGTLLDTLDDITIAVVYALKKHALPPRTKEEVRSFIGNGIAKLMERAKGDGVADAERLTQDFKDYYKAHCKDETKPYAGIVSLLNDLKANGVKTAVLSNKADFATRLLVKDYFDGLIDEAAGENEAAGIRRKPAPDALFSMMETLGVKREETLYVGDSDVDIQTAKNAGVDCVSVTWGFKDEDFLTANGAQALANTPSEIFKICMGK